MNQPKYQIGDRASVAGLPVTIHDTDYLGLSGKRLYTVRFDYNKALTIVDSSEVNPPDEYRFRTGDQNSV